MATSATQHPDSHAFILFSLSGKGGQGVVGKDKKHLREGGE